MTLYPAISSQSVQIVSVGDPETLIVNKSTKYTLLIGENSGVGTGNQLTNTPLGPYESVVVNGKSDVWAVAQTAGQTLEVVTTQNALRWTPQAVQPNIIDPASPYFPAVGAVFKNFNVPPEAQGVFISWVNPVNYNGDLIVTGVQTDAQYFKGNPSTLGSGDVWVPIVSDADSQIQITTNTSAADRLSIVWIMSPVAAALVESGNPIQVTVTGSTIVGGLPVDVVNTANVNVTEIAGLPASNPLTVVDNITEISGVTFGTAYLPVGISNPDPRSISANQEPIAFDQTITGSGGIMSLLAATAGVQYFLHEFYIQCATPGTIMYVELQDTTPHTFARIYNDVDGTPTNTYKPSTDPTNLHGSPIPVGLGVRITNLGTASVRVIGHLSYSM